MGKSPWSGTHNLPAQAGSETVAPLPELRTDALQSLLTDQSLLADRLSAVDTVPLLLVYAHLSGDEAMLAKFAPYIKGAWSFEENAPASLQQELRQSLIETLKEYRDYNRPLPPPPPLDLLRKMLDTAVGQHVPDEFIPMVQEEISFDGTDSKSVHWRKKPEARLKSFKALVIGAGFSGLAMALKLKEAGIDYVLIEKNDEVGGTWYENSYPGCAVDTPNHFYSYSFRLDADWNYYFARRDEIFNYIKKCYAEMQISDYIRFNEEVISTVWDAKKGLWNATVRRADGSTYDIHANIVVSATGLLNRPAYPDIPGIKEFKGPLFHSARWDHGVDLTGKRVALVGTGASGMQIGPNIAHKVKHLTIFQRSPHWARANPLIFRQVSDEMKWALKNIPFYAKWFRILFLWATSDGLFHTLFKDPNWSEPENSLNALNKDIRESIIAHITKEVNGDPELLKKVIPAFPPYGKRMLRDGNWYKTLTRDNVNLVTGPIQKFTAYGIVDENGVEHELDVIILATGFKAQQPLAPMEVVGSNGSLRDHWGEDNPRAYLGITVPEFPNLFMLYGPNTNGGHGGSALFHSECQIRYVMQALREMLERGDDVLEVRKDPFEEYNRKVDERHAQLVWTHPGVKNWYRNKSGRVVTNSPWRMVDYRNLTAEFNPAEYTFARATNTSEASKAST